MASIVKVQRKTGTAYRVQVRRKGYPTITKTFKLKRHADAFAREIEGNLEEHSALLKGEVRRHTVGELIDRYMDQHGGKDMTVISRIAWWKGHYGERSLADFSKATVQEGLEALRTGNASHGGSVITETDQRRSPSTVNRYLTAISTAFRTAIKLGWFGLEDNPCSGIGRGQEKHRFGRYLTDDERNRLLTACERSDWSGLIVLVRLALATGARRGELLKLRWQDIDFERGIIQLWATKNGTDRVVPVVAPVLERLREWGKVRTLGVDLVFPRSDGKPYNIDPVWRRAKAEADVDDFRFHDLRHSAASYLAMHGASPLQIGAVLGHRTLVMVQRYSHLNTAGTADLLEAALGEVLS